MWMDIKFVDQIEAWKRRAMVIDTNAQPIMMNPLFLERLAMNSNNKIHHDIAVVLQSRLALFATATPLPLKWNITADKLAWTIYHLLADKNRINSLLQYHPVEQTLTQSVTSQSTSRNYPLRFEEAKSSAPILCFNSIGTIINSSRNNSPLIRTPPYETPEFNSRIPSPEVGDFSFSCLG